MTRHLNRILRYFGYRRTFGGAIVPIQPRVRYTPSGKFASDEDAAIWFRGEKTW